MFGDDDMDAFFSEGTVTVIRHRPGVPDIEFQAIPGLSDEQSLDARVLSPQREIAFPSRHDMRSGDTCTVVGDGSLVMFDGQYRVREHRRVNDGLEARALLQLINAA